MKIIKHRIGVVLFSLICIFTLCNYSIVNAETNACAPEEDVFSQKGRNLIFSPKVDADYEIKKYIDGDETNEKGSVNAGDKVTFTCPNDKDCVFTLIASYSNCEFTFPASFQSIKTTKINNQKAVNICNGFKNGNYSDIINSISNDRAKNNIKSSLTLFGPHKSDVLNDKDFISLCDSVSDKPISELQLVNSIISFFKFYDTQSKIDANIEKMNNVNTNGFTLVNNGKISLKCDPWARNGLSRTSSFESDSWASDKKHNTNPLDGDKYYLEANTKRYYHTNEKVVINKTGSKGQTFTCTKKCTEKLTVRYGAPVAVKAGACFQYRVKVDSEVTCGYVNMQAPKPVITNYYIPGCSVVGSCNYISEKTKDQAGPSEEFDNCVNKCDGGKYSQKCINTCYKKVYGKQKNNKANKLTNVFDTYSVTNLGIDISPDGYETSCTLPFCNIKINDLDSIINRYASYDNNGNLIEYYKKNGYYYWNGNSIVWKSVTDDLYSSIGSAYFRTKDRIYRALTNLAGHPYNGFWGILRNGQYYYTRDGFLRASNCKETCTWEAYDSSGNRGNNVSCPDELLGTAIYFDQKKYDDDMKLYNETIKSCTGTVTCSKHTKEVTVKINATNDKDETYLTNKIDGQRSYPFRNDSVIYDYSKCYGNKDEENKYLLEWNLPYSYVDFKHNDRTTQRPKDYSGWVRTNKFCLPLNSSTVNETWFNWYTNTLVKEDDEKYGCSKIPENSNSKVYKKITDSIKYNITASVKNFGFDWSEFNDNFKWDIDLGCFFASGKSTDSIKNSKDDNTSGSEEACTKNPNPQTDDFIWRSVNNGNLFNTNSETIQSRSSDDIGFNWTRQAENLNNSDYLVKPSVIKERIENLKDKVYSDDYLEYEFKLTKEDLKKIRDYNKYKKLSDFASDSDSYIVENGIRTYQSPLFRGKGIITPVRTRKLACNHFSKNDVRDDCKGEN